MFNHYCTHTHTSTRARTHNVAMRNILLAHSSNVQHLSCKTYFNEEVKYINSKKSPLKSIVETMKKALLAHLTPTTTRDHPVSSKHTDYVLFTMSL